jgi:hypothetical protein
VSESVTVRPQRDIVLLADCSRALSTQDGSPRAIQTCVDAVAAADQAGAAAYAPRSARSFLGDVYMFAKRWSDALAAYQSARSIPKASDTSDLGTGEIKSANSPHAASATHSARKTIIRKCRCTRAALCSESERHQGQGDPSDRKKL